MEFVDWFPKGNVRSLKAGTISQKTELLITAAVRTSNPTTQTHKLKTKLRGF
jgi:hypothetical protein